MRTKPATSAMRLRSSRNNVHFTGEKSGSTGGQGGYGAPAPMQAPAARPAPAEPVSYAAGSADDFAVIDDNEDLPF